MNIEIDKDIQDFSDDIDNCFNESDYNKGEIIYLLEEFKSRIINEELDKLKEELVEKHKSEIYVSGNKGGNSVKLKQIDDNRVSIEVVDCCVYSVKNILTAEAFSSVLTDVYLRNNDSFLNSVKDTMRWTDDIKNEFMKNCE